MKTKSVKSINQWQSVIQTTHYIVKAHGGEMEIVSEPGSTVFSIRLNQKDALIIITDHKTNI